METDFVQQSLLIQHFRSFYQELVRLKGHALSSSLLTESDVSEKSLARYIFNRLVELLSDNRTIALQDASPATQAYYNEALYIMVALADEVFLYLQWPGQQVWYENLLEVYFFNTHKAGESFYKKLDLFLSKNNKAHQDLAVLYLWALGLGFFGQYDQQHDDSAVELYKKRLFALIRYGSAETLAPESLELLSPCAYKHILRGSKPSYQPSMRFWYKCLYGAIGGMFLISTIIWQHDIQEIREVLNITNVVEVET